MRKSRLSRYKLDRIIEEFAYGLPAKDCAKKVKVNRNTAVRHYHHFRTLIREWMRAEMSPQFDGIMEMDECYVGGKFHGGKRGRGAYGKVIVFGILQRRQGDSIPKRVFACAVPDVRGETLLPIILRHVRPGATIYTDGNKTYNKLTELGFDHRVVNHSKGEWARGGIHTNGIESFWAFLKHELARYKGIPRGHFDLFLAEIVWRFFVDNRDERKRQLKQMIRQKK